MSVNSQNMLRPAEQALAPLSAAPTSVRQWLRGVSLNDWIVLAYLGGLDIAIMVSGQAGHEKNQAMLQMTGLLLGFLIVVPLLIRGGIMTHPFLTPLAFRLSHYGGIQLTYFFMRGFLPIVNPGSLDLELHRVGTRLFGLEPALAMQPWISPATTEWFAFFYYGYFFVLGLHVIPILFAAKNPRLLSEFALGLLLVLSVGQSFYLLVPGYGPANGLPALFESELPPGVWWNLVRQIVESAGAQKDIFPSIHTAAPTFILLFSFHNRAYLPYRYTWPMVAFFAFNIIVATMFLRWHWLLDIVAGLALALFGYLGAIYGTRWELRRRALAGLPPAWPEWPAKRREPRLHTTSARA